jgi:hypothetical protein
MPLSKPTEEVYLRPRWIDVTKGAEELTIMIAREKGVAKPRSSATRINSKNVSAAGTGAEGRKTTLRECWSGGGRSIPIYYHERSEEQPTTPSLIHVAKKWGSLQQVNPIWCKWGIRWNFHDMPWTLGRKTMVFPRRRLLTWDDMCDAKPRLD